MHPGNIILSGEYGLGGTIPLVVLSERCRDEIPPFVSISLFLDSMAKFLRNVTVTVSIRSGKFAQN